MRYAMSAQRARRPAPRFAQRGFTLVELMVGVLLAMLTTVVIAQVLAMAEGQKRTATSGNDAQVSGALALYTFQRDLQMAGYGVVSNPGAMGCTVQYGADSDKNFLLAPVVITEGDKGGPDTISVLMSNHTGASMPIKLAAAHGATDSHFTVSGAMDINAGDVLIAIPKLHDSTLHCSLLTVTDNASGTAEEKISGTNIPHAAVSSGVIPSSGFDTDAYVVDMGSMVYRTYSISSGQMLQSGTLSTATGKTTQQDLYPSVVNLQAFYGQDSDGDGKVDKFTTTTPANASEWATVMSIRLAVVTRSAEFQKEEVTTGPISWNVGKDAAVTGATTCGDSQCIDLKVDTQDDWKHFRYRMFETVIPLRNVLWNS
ncbi:MAG: hypothetical protein EPO12_13895 [Aquabacterium sp.]|nr:MAG: hypothetical protein EPO12_13895 [Aquabacterium sp.]